MEKVFLFLLCPFTVKWSFSRKKLFFPFFPFATDFPSSPHYFFLFIILFRLFCFVVGYFYNFVQLLTRSRKAKEIPKKAKEKTKKSIVLIEKFLSESFFKLTLFFLFCCWTGNSKWVKNKKKRKEKQKTFSIGCKKWKINFVWTK